MVKPEASFPAWAMSFPARRSTLDGDGRPRARKVFPAFPASCVDYLDVPRLASDYFFFCKTFGALNEPIRSIPSQGCDQTDNSIF